VARCTGLAKGAARLGVSRKVARRLGLASRTLAKGTATCGADKRASVLLKPVKRVRNALARGKARTAIRRARGLDATLAVVFTGDGAKLTDTLAIRLAR
jgi:hypothetical protein